MTAAAYPVHVQGRLDAPLSRWLWLVKWLLALPHFVVLALLWPAYALFSLFAFVAILVTGRYPRTLFDFNVGVLRWSWRVAYYSYGANGTDRYPPFTLADDATYPARLDVEYPEHLSRGLVLVKWLLALPHYLVVALFGGGVWFLWHGSGFGFGGLIGVLVLVAVVALAVTGAYPRGLYDFVLGMNRWVLRVAAYAGLMTDEYPPFRLDMGGDEGGVTTLPPPAPPGQQAPPAGTGWTGGRVVAAVAGALLLMISAGLGLGGAAVLWADRTQRDAEGFLMSGTERFTTQTYALATNTVELESYPSGLLGDVRVTVHDATARVFVGIAPAAEARAYLAAFEHATVTDWRDAPVYTDAGSGAPTGPPGEASFWVAFGEVQGTASLDWSPRDGDWVLVVMNADGARGVTARVAVGAEAPALGWVAFGLFAGAAATGVSGAVLVAVAVRRAGRREGM